MLPKPQKPLTQPQQTGAGDNSQLDQNRRRQQRGTGFTNINRILGANQGAGQRIGEAIGSNIGNQAGQVRQGLEQGMSQFQAGLTQGKSGADTAIQQGQALKQQSGESNDAYAKRLATGTQDFEKQGLDLQNAMYKGPNEMQNANQIQTQAMNIANLRNLAGTSSGQSQLLRSQVAQRGNYTQGQNALDQLLLGKEGQGAIQQGRQSSAGIDQQASGAVSNAQNQASATTKAILRNKAKTTEELRNYLQGEGTAESGNITGFTKYAKNQAEEYQKNARRIQELLSGKDEKGNAITSLSDNDKALLENMQGYGVENNKIYEKGNTDSILNALGKVGSSLTQDFGASRYLGDQSGAAQNLAKFLQQQDTAKNIANTKFNENVFEGDQRNLFGENDERYKFDKQTQDDLFRMADRFKAAEDLGAKEQERFKELLEMQAQSGKNFDYSNLANRDREMLEAQKKQTDLRAAAIATGGFGTGHAFYVDPSRVEDYNPIQDQQDKVVAQLQREHPMYGLLHYGSADVDPRFKGLGLQHPGIRNYSKEYRAAGEKALGNMTDVKNYVLNRYLKGQG
jgi:hypothetical protein